MSIRSRMPVGLKPKFDQQLELQHAFESHLLRERAKRLGSQRRRMDSSGGQIKVRVVNKSA